MWTGSEGEGCWPVVPDAPCTELEGHPFRCVKSQPNPMKNRHRSLEKYVLDVNKQNKNDKT